MERQKCGICLHHQQYDASSCGYFDSYISDVENYWNNRQLYSTDCSGMGFGGGAFYIFLLRQFYLGIPKDFDEAAYLDGASHIQIFTKIILPITKPALAVVGMFAFLNSWNDFLSPLVYLNSEKKYTVALGLQLFTGSYRGEWNLMMAAACLVLAPVVVVFAIGQKYLVEGVTMSGVKG